MKIKCSFDEAEMRMKKLAKKLESEGKIVQTFPVGGSCPESMWAYVDCWAEMESQYEFFDQITDVVAVYGTGGTVLDLALGNYWSGMKKRVHGVSILSRSEFKASDFFTDAKKCLEETGIKDVPIKEIVDIIEGYVGECYADTWPELRQFSLAVARKTGIILDTTYTCKAVYGESNDLGIGFTADIQL